MCAGKQHTVSFHNFKSQNFKLSVSNPKNKYVAYLSVLSQISNCQGLGRKNKHDILKTDRMTMCIRDVRHLKGRGGEKSSPCAPRHPFAWPRNVRFVHTLFGSAFATHVSYHCHYQRQRRIVSPNESEPPRLTPRILLRRRAETNTKQHMYPTKPEVGGEAGAAKKPPISLVVDKAEVLL